MIVAGQDISRYILNVVSIINFITESHKTTARTMDEKISLEAIALYGDAYADKVLKNFFASKEKISGQEILKLCNVQQVNLFVVRELFKTWREETKKVKSPYFDYENPEVKEALDNFMSTASQHILIGQAHFGPLLKKAVSQTLMVIFDPYDFYSMTISGRHNKLEVAPFREEIKYLKINRAPLEKMLQKLEEKGVQEVPGNEAFSILDGILEEVNFTPEDLEDYVAKFSEIVPLDPTRFIVPKGPDEVAPPTEAKKEVEPVKETVKAEPVKPEPIKETLKSEPIKTEPIRNEPTKVNQPKSVGDVKHAPTINDKMNAQQTMLVDNFRKIGRIKDSLTINQKFMFTKVLFHGDFELFSKAIDRLDQFENMNGALRYLEEEYASTWDRDSEEFHEFMEMVEKRFS
jgi:hypothetical protein